MLTTEQDKTLFVRYQVDSRCVPNLSFFGLVAGERTLSVDPCRHQPAPSWRLWWKNLAVMDM